MSVDNCDYEPGVQDLHDIYQIGDESILQYIQTRMCCVKRIERPIRVHYYPINALIFMRSFKIVLNKLIVPKFHYKVLLYFWLLPLKENERFRGQMNSMVW